MCAARSRRRAGLDFPRRSWQVVEIIKAGGWRAADVRPLVRLNVSVVCADGSAWKPAAPARAGARLRRYLQAGVWKREADEAIRQSLVNLQSVPAPAGEMPVVLGSGWVGRAVARGGGPRAGGRFHRKKTSMFTSMMGDRRLARVTVVDDGTLAAAAARSPSTTRARRPSATC